MNYYPFHIGDYARDTAHLSILEDGAYRRLIDLYYATEKPLAKDRTKLYRLVRAQSKAERSAIDTVLAEFFSETEMGWTHTRCDTEIAKAKEKSDKARRSIESRWNNERNTNEHTNEHTNVLPTKNKGNTPNNQEPITNNQEPNLKPKRAVAHGWVRPDWLPPEWDEFEQHRIEKKQRLTPTARKRCVQQLDQWRMQGHDIRAILVRSLSNGWTGIFPLDAKPNGGNQSVAEEWSRGAVADTVERVIDAGR